MLNTRLLTTAVLLFWASLGGADLMIVEQVHTDPTSIMGQERPAQDMVSTRWIGVDRMRSGSEEQPILVRLDLKKLYLLDPKAKTALSVDLPIDFKQLFPAEMAQMADQMKQMSAMTVTVTPADKVEKVGKWTAKPVDMKATTATGLAMEMTFWLTNEVKFPAESRYKEMVEGLSELQPTTAWLKDLAKLEGFAVRSRVSMDLMGSKMNTTSEVTSIEEKAAPAGTYDVPADYAVKPLNMLEMMQQQSGR